MAAGTDTRPRYLTSVGHGLTAETTEDKTTLKNNQSMSRTGLGSNKRVRLFGDLNTLRGKGVLSVGTETSDRRLRVL
jgi:hypothetical protein